MSKFSFLLFFFVITFITSQVTYDTSVSIKDTGEVTFDDSITAHTLIDQMGMGWNLGNTLDAFDGKATGLDTETCWGNPLTTQDMIQAVKKKGFNTIRLPTTWHVHLIDDKYTIDPVWMKRIKEIVDWAIEAELYVILNTHHDNNEDGNVKYGTGYYPNNKNKEESEKYLINVWTQIAEAFNNGYDHHLIFEGLNEPRPVGDQYEWWYNPGAASCEEAISTLNEFNQVILDTVRKSGGNNAKRFYMFSSIGAAQSYAIADSFKVPDDSKSNPSNRKVLLSVHMYTPYNFAMNDKGGATFGDSEKKELDSTFKQVYDKFVSKGVLVVIGELGTINKNNLDARVAWAKYYVENVRKLQMAPVVWDNGYFGDGVKFGDTWALLHREQCTWEPEELVNAYISSAKTPLGG